MNVGRRRALALAAGMGATALLATWLRPVSRGAQDLSRDGLVPDRFGSWQLDRDAASFVRAADRRGRQTGIYDQVLERTFMQSGGQRVMLSVAYLGAQSSDMQLHRPEVCYRAGGFRIVEPHDAHLAINGRSVAVTRLVAEMPGRPEPVTYWTVVDGMLVSGKAQGLWDRLQRAAQRRGAAGVLVRISSIDPDPSRAFGVHAGFAAELVQALTPAGRELFTGSPIPARS
jgi:EpsI family protein